MQGKGKPAQLTVLPLENIRFFYANWSLHKIRDTPIFQKVGGLNLRLPQKRKFFSGFPNLGCLLGN